MLMVILNWKLQVSFFTMSKTVTILEYSYFLSVPDPGGVTVETVDAEGLPLFLPKETVTNITLSCSVGVHPNVDIPVVVTMNWNGPENFARTLTTTINETDTLSSEVTINDLNIRKAGEYNCTATITARSKSLFITGNGTRSNSTTLALCK